jgi:hypothetical protein
MTNLDSFIKENQRDTRLGQSRDVLERMRTTLKAIGYASTTTQMYLRAIEHFRNQLAIEGRDLLSIQEEDVQTFLRS